MYYLLIILNSNELNLSTINTVRFSDSTNQSNSWMNYLRPICEQNQWFKEKSLAQKNNLFSDPIIEFNLLT